MREILFRAKRKDNGEWIEGSLVCYRDIVSIIVYDEQYYDNYRELPSFRVIPETVGQYTGLTDKNGVKIFEGDIVEYLAEYSSIYSRTEKATVHRNDSTGAFCARNRLGTDYILGVFNEVKVTGNIHANPELPEGE